MRKILCASLIAAFALVGCKTTIPPEALSLSPDSLKLRQLQSRKFETNDDVKIIRASVGVLQDLGFTIEETESELGVVSGSKDRDATEAGQVVGAVMVALIFGIVPSVDEKQKIRASLVTRKHGEKGQSIVTRITFHRIVWNTQKAISNLERLEDPEMYQEFFSKLSKAVFLEANEI